MSKVYLAGSITGLSYNSAVDWRQEVKSKLEKMGMQGLSPMRGKDYLLERTSITQAYDKVLTTQKAIVTRDRNDVYTCDAILMNLLGAERVSIGTMIELAWADAWRKPVVLVMESGNLHDHAMVRELAGFIVSSLDEGVAVLGALLNADSKSVDLAVGI